MTFVVLSLTVCFVSLVYGMYQSGHFIYKVQVPFSNRQSTIKEIFVPSDDNGLIYCDLQCVREPKCLAIEMCPREDRQRCRLCNTTNPSFSDNETDSCRHLESYYQRDNTDTCPKGSVFHTCKDILKNAEGKMVSSGVYRIDIDCKPTEVWCDMETDGGGWTVIQRRHNGITDFYLSWNEYKTGFGNVSDEYWIDDCFSRNNGTQFSTKDRDNDLVDRNCAVEHHGGWWYERCTLSNMNGWYQTSGTVNYICVFCWNWTGGFNALRETRMMIR